MGNNPTKTNKPKRKRGPISDAERQRRREQRRYSIVGALLHSRAQTAAMLGTSTMTVIRLEEAGLLTPIRLSAKPLGKVYHDDQQVRALIQTRVDQGSKAVAS